MLQDYAGFDKNPSPHKSTYGTHNILLPAFSHFLQKALNLYTVCTNEIYIWF